MKKNRLITWNKQDWIKFIIGNFLGVASVSCAAALPFLVKEAENIFTNNTNNNKTVNAMLIILSIMVAIGIVGILLGYISKIFLAKLSSNNIARIRQDLFEKSQSLSMEEMKKYDKSTLLTRLTTDIYNFTIYYNWLLINVVPSVIRWLVFMIMTLLLNYIIGSIMLGLSIIMFFVTFLLSRKSITYFEKSLSNVDRVNTIVGESITGARVIKSFNLKKRQIKRFDLINHQVQENSTKADQKAFSSWPFALMLANGSAILVLLFAAIIQWSGVHFAGTKIDLGTILAIFSYSYLILWSVFDLTFLYVYEARAKTPKKRILEILQIQNTQISKTNLFEYGDIEFCNVNYKYDSESKESILENISLRIPQNSSLGIIGTTGSGKTTLLNLLVGLYKPNDGQILINGIDSQEIDSASLIENISFAFQEKMLFAGTIKENILFANDNLSDEEIWNVLKLAQLDKFIQTKEEGLNFYIEQKGANLSGGQKQRLNIARAMAKKAKLYLFDDATSALDNLTEKQILNNLSNICSDSIFVLTSQKISSIQNLDQIIVLQEGKIESIGNHEQLMKTCNIYQQIYQFQTGGDLE